MWRVCSGRKLCLMNHYYNVHSFNLFRQEPSQ